MEGQKMKIYYVLLCAWHPKYWGHKRTLGMKTEEKPDNYDGDQVVYSHGICDLCKKKVLKEAGIKEEQCPKKI